MLQQLFRFIKYYFQAGTRYDIHSPFVFDFTENILEDDRLFYAFSLTESFRNRLKSDPTNIEVTDLGAGSLVVKSRTRTLRSLVTYSANNPYTCRLLFRIVHYFKPGNLLELGTSLGISTAYQAMAAPGSRFITIEGCPNVAEYARETFRLLGLGAVELRPGRFDDVLPQALQDLKTLDYLFVDGNHRRDATLLYFQQCLQFAGENSIFIFGDIHWSSDMEAAWQEIKSHPKVRITIDLYFLGIVFFCHNQSGKAHHVLCPWIWKPWRIGIRDFFKP